MMIKERGTRRLLLALLVLWISCAATVNGSSIEVEVERKEVDWSTILALSSSPAEPVVDQDLDCGMRKLFLQQAIEKLWWRPDHQDIADALELESRCSDYEPNVATDPMTLRKRIEHTTSSNEQDIIEEKTKRSMLKGSKPKQVEEEGEEEQSRYYYVCPVDGKDHADSGTEKRPFRTVHWALKMMRIHRQRRTSTEHHQDVIVLRKGIHYLQRPVQLTPQDSNLTIRSAPYERAWLSGGTLVDTQRAQWSFEPDSRSKKIWVASIPPSIMNHDITGLFTIHPHTRLTLARFPNANVEEWDAKDRYANIDYETDAWLFPPPAGVPKFEFYNLTDPNNPTGYTKDDSLMEEYNMYGTGQGGACATVWDSNVPSYWCSNVSAGGWAEVDQAAALAGRLNLPAGLRLTMNSTPTTATIADDESFQERILRLWKHDPKGAIFHVGHTQGWAWHMFNVSKIETTDTDYDTTTTTTTTIQFDKGGQQGGRNWQCKDKESGRLSNCNGETKILRGGPWYVEGILEELDTPGEFYWDATTKKLYLYPPDCDDDTACVPPDLIATNLQTLIHMDGTPDNPIQNIQLEGLGFRDTRKTFMEPWAAPSGGDWALHRGGAVHLEGTEHLMIADCQFQRLDGNAIMLGGYNRYTTVRRSEFNWLGEGAIATWGDSDGYDATGGAQPRFSLVEDNVMSNLGLYQKQSSAWGQNKACQTTIRNNVMFNLPRAAINFNDGLGGGNLVERNVIFNTCRESGDHGPINSWDRMPFLTNTTGSPSFTPLSTHTQHNIIMANYGASQGFDNDDGSSWYYTHDNVFYEADGFKMDYGGHSSRFTNNLVYTSGRKSCYGTGSFKDEVLADKFANNTCIVADPSNDAPTLGHLFQCALKGMNPTSNKYYSATGNGTFFCGSDQWTLQGMQENGFELGSTVGVIPTADTILSWAREVLARSTL